MSLLILLLVFTSFSSRTDTPIVYGENEDLIHDDSILYYYEADLSDVNKMEDCGAIFRYNQNKLKDIYQIFKEAGTNII